jgi:small subunit ribosomal protein S18
MTTEINNQDNGPVDNQEEKTTETAAAKTQETEAPAQTSETTDAAKPTETADAAKTTEAAVSETADAAKTTETAASETADAAKTTEAAASETADAAKTTETAASETADAAKTTETAASTEKTEKKPGGPSERRPGQGDQRRERPQGEGYQRRDSSQRFSKFRRKVCYFCANKGAEIDYKDADTLGRFITDRGKILPRRVTGVCARHQRGLANAIKKARIIALIPFIEK